MFCEVVADVWMLETHWWDLSVHRYYEAHGMSKLGVVSRLGLEPRALALKGRCSTD